MELAYTLYRGYITYNAVIAYLFLKINKYIKKKELNKKIYKTATMACNVSSAKKHCFLAVAVFFLLFIYTVWLICHGSFLFFFPSHRTYAWSQVSGMDVHRSYIRESPMIKEDNRGPRFSSRENVGDRGLSTNCQSTSSGPQRWHTHKVSLL